MLLRCGACAVEIGPIHTHVKLEPFNPRSLQAGLVRIQIGADFENSPSKAVKLFIRIGRRENQVFESGKLGENLPWGTETGS